MLSLLSLLATQLLPAPRALPPVTVVARRPMPEVVKAIYATSSTAHTARINNLKQLIATTELNAIVINTKEPSGPKLDNHLKELVQELKASGIWTIARQVVFQDDELAARQPELALKRGNGTLWRDRGGKTWVDPSSRVVWEYNLKVARQTISLGFDELNLDYVRFPTDGDVKAIRFPNWKPEVSKAETIAGFAGWLRRELRASHPGVVVSADVFAYSFMTNDDLGMGQDLKLLAPNLDVVAPMIYPSHYRRGNFGFTNPALHPYEVVRQTLERGQPALTSAPNTIVRPWLQDFNLGARYTAEFIRAEFEGVADAGGSAGWMLWNPHNVYTTAALAPKASPAAQP